jgi:hypothetical protein
MPDYTFTLDSPGVTDIVIPDINTSEPFLLSASVAVDGDVVWSAQANQGDPFGVNNFDWVDVENTTNSSVNLDIEIDYPVRGFRIAYHSGTGSVSGMISY